MLVVVVVMMMMGVVVALIVVVVEEMVVATEAATVVAVLITSAARLTALPSTLLVGPSRMAVVQRLVPKQRSPRHQRPLTGHRRPRQRRGQRH